MFNADETLPWECKFDNIKASCSIKGKIAVYLEHTQVPAHIPCNIQTVMI